MTKKRLDLAFATEEEVRAEIERLLEALEKGMVWPKKYKLYLHADKESNWGHAEKLGLEGDQARNFAYTCYEVEVNLEVHQDGSAFATHFSGVELKTKVKV
jgi:hypothetical protein